jgi:hypothetical protein
MSDELKEKVSKMTDGQIRRIVKLNLSHLGHNAVKYAEEEFNKRGLVIEQQEYITPRHKAISTKEPRGISAPALGIILSVIFMLFWFFIAIVIPQNAETVPTKARIIALIIPLGFILFVFFTVRYNLLRKRRKAIQKQNFIEQSINYKNHVLYLRSFIADEDASDVIGTSTEEEHLAIVLNQLGSFIAIGRPGEQLPELGAVRLYVKDDQWQDTVLDLMRKAQVVVMRIGDSPGFWWEFERAIQIIRPQQLLLLVPEDAELYRQFRKKAKDYLSTPLPEFFNYKPEGVLKRSVKKIFAFYKYGYLPFFTAHTIAPAYFRSLRGVIYFESNYLPHKIKFSSNWIRGNYSSPGIPILIKALKPFFKQLNFSIKRPRISLIKVSALLFAFLFLGIQLIAIFIGSPK